MAIAATWFDVVVLSVVEGITEFLPVSSTGHMILTRAFLGLSKSEALDAFLVIVQAGAILAVVSVFWRLFLKWLLAWVQLFVKGSAPQISLQEGLALRAQSLAIAASVIPFAIVGFLFKDFIKSLFSPQVVAWALITGGVFILVSEKLLSRRSSARADVGASELTAERASEAFTFKDAVIVGFGQCLALWPGFSRSAATILFSRFAGFSRSAAAEISFLVGLPTLLGTAGYEALKESKHLDSTWMAYLGVGILVAWVVAYVCVRTFVAFLRRFPLSVFAWYRIVAGSLILWYFASHSQA